MTDHDAYHPSAGQFASGVRNSAMPNSLDNEISTTVPDWSREAINPARWQPSRSLLCSIRRYQRNQGQKGVFPSLKRKFAVLSHRFWSVVTGADIPLNTRIGGGLLMPHPNGIVIHPAVEIGPNCLIFQQVTLGATQHGTPTIGGHVDIGAGAKIIGPVTVGDGARIGANALVIYDVPAYATVVAPAAQPL